MPFGTHTHTYTHTHTHPHTHPPTHTHTHTDTDTHTQTHRHTDTQTQTHRHTDTHTHTHTHCPLLTTAPLPLQHAPWFLFFQTVLPPCLPRSSGFRLCVWENMCTICFSEDMVVSGPIPPTPIPTQMASLYFLWATTTPLFLDAALPVSVPQLGGWMCWGSYSAQVSLCYA
jgi:hypothetical protein